VANYIHLWISHVNSEEFAIFPPLQSPIRSRAPPSGLATTISLLFWKELRSDFLRYCARIFEMSGIVRSRPAATPAKSKIFAKPAELVPKPTRYLRARNPMDINVERMTGQVFGSE